MPFLTQSDLSELARYPASLRSAARAAWGGGLADGRSDDRAPVARFHHKNKGAGSPPGEII